MLGDTSLSEGVLRITAETMVVWARDTKRPMIEAVEALRDRVPGWHYVELAEGGHMFPLTRPDLINPHVRAFLDGKADVSREEVRP